MELEAKHLAILRVIQAIPRGHVMTYGQVAQAAGLPRRARLVGKLLRELPAGSNIPWHRVVNAQGTISDRGNDSVARQRRLLESEGVGFDNAGRIDLELVSTAICAICSIGDSLPTEPPSARPKRPGGRNPGMHPPTR